HPAFLVGEPLQESETRLVVGVRSERVRRQMILRDVIALDITQDADESEIDGVCKGRLNRWMSMIFPFYEIVEDMHAAAGEEGFSRTRRILPLHRRVEHGLQAAIVRARDIRERPLRERIARLVRQLNEPLPRQLRVAV